jgi:hypothetical protein
VDKQEIGAVVGLMLRALGQIAKTTRTPADDMLVAIVRANETRLAEAVALLKEAGEPVTDQQVVEALKKVGIRLNG